MDFYCCCSLFLFLMLFYVCLFFACCCCFLGELGYCFLIIAEGIQFLMIFISFGCQAKCFRPYFSLRKSAYILIED